MLRRFVSLSLFACLYWVAATQTIQAQTLEPVATLPTNVEIPAEMRAELVKTWQRSATFRQQCARIAAASHLTIRMEYLIRTALQLQSYRALTTYKRRPDGTAHALVRISIDSLLPELVGHEFEHVIEQLDGLPLRTLATYANASVTRSDNGIYETERARCGQKSAG